MKALLQFKRFKVLEMVYRDSFKGGFPDTLSPEFGVQIGLNESNSRQSMVNLSVEIGEETDDSYLKVTIAGIFEFDSDSDVDDDVIYQYYEINGTAILFPYLRSIVSDLSSKGEESPIILPTINITELLQSRNDDEVIE